MMQYFGGAICTAQDPCNLGGVVVAVVGVLFVSYALLVGGSLYGFYKFRKRKDHSKVAIVLMYLWLAIVAIPAVLTIGSALIN